MQGHVWESYPRTPLRGTNYLSAAVHRVLELRTRWGQRLFFARSDNPDSQRPRLTQVSSMLQNK